MAQIDAGCERRIGRLGLTADTLRIETRKRVQRWLEAFMIGDDLLGNIIRGDVAATELSLKCSDT